MSPKHELLQVLMEPYWGRLSPIHQSTSNADTLLGNVFESLVDLSPQGGIVSGVAEGWRISDDDRVFRFFLRAGVRFSNGVPLSAEIYRRALLQSVVSLDRDSPNPNALDVLYRLKGFSLQAAEADQVEGLRVDSDGALVIEFSAPFRTALAELTGTRYAAWLLDEKTGSYLGTGPYQIVHDLENSEVDFAPNPFAWKDPLYQKVAVRESPHGVMDLSVGKGQVYVGRPARAEELQTATIGSQVQFQRGSIASHAVIAVNGVPGKLFSDPCLRLAVQYAVHLVAPAALEKVFDPRRLTLDAQFFLPRGVGRLSDEEAKGLVARGQPYFSDLVSASQEKPIEFLSSSPIVKGIQIGLERMGLRFLHPFRVDDVKFVIEAAYGKHDYDLNFLGSMVVGNDPDGLYHVFGKSGALASPATARPGVEAAFETGRSISSGQDLHPYYVEVSRRIFEEVPEIHLAYGHNGAYFDSDKVVIKDRGMNSARFHFDCFVPR